MSADLHVPLDHGRAFSHVQSFDYRVLSIALPNLKHGALDGPFAPECVIIREPQRCGRVKITYEKGILFIRLPSGRRLAYVKPRIGVNKFGGDSITYEGIGEQRKWMRLESYGPKFVENIVQATARDLLVEAMRRLSHKGYKIVMHIHDEVVLEVPDEVSSVAEVCAIMAETPLWAVGLILNADGYECDFYKKD